MAKLHTREILDYERSCRPVCSARIENHADLPPGTHLHWCRYGSWHDGILVSTNPVSKRMKIIRYCHVFWRGMVLREEQWVLNLDSDKVYKYNYGQHCHPPSVVLTRARACINQKGYNALRNNNDDFCRWCKSGRHTYFCVNESYLSSDVDMSTRSDDGIYRVTITSMTGINLGDYLTWAPLYHSVGQKSFDTRHGIVIGLDEKRLQLRAFSDKSHTLDVITMSQNDFYDHKIRHCVFERCHMPDDVLSRSSADRDELIFPDDVESFCVWCKTGLPADSDAVDIEVLTTQHPHPDEADGETKPGCKAVVNTVTRSAATGTVRAIEGAAVKAAAETAAKQAPRVLVRGAAEGAAAAAAIVVEGAVLGYDVGMTYRSFNRKEVNKDTLLEQNITNTTRSIGAAGASIGGGAAGAAIGTIIFPGAGTIAGGIIGGIIGGVAGQAGGHFAGKGIAKAARRPYENLFVEDIANMQEMDTM